MIEEAAQALADDAHYPENSVVRAALSLVNDAGPAALADVYRHQLTYVAREARWRLGSIASEHAIDVLGSQWLDEVRDRPVLTVMPMQMCTSDAINVVSKCFPGRQIIFFGEGVDASHYPWMTPTPLFASQGMQGVKQIMDVLVGGGVFCTYPDFVYQGRGALPYAMFGRPRSMASAMLSIAIKTRAFYCLHSAGSLSIRSRSKLTSP
ncbi:hypothetical protein CNR27_12510 [Luteimonas chenhongjianii]|uniref:Uncharacterized protein n=1 Tax=Luteimonas chenhongjianii TaxID=2006110 RepID=A0A290XGG2_9GAMM|nr:hypothetical protein CNR27_12510 [Luteimonas chenhongjianii]